MKVSQIKYKGVFALECKTQNCAAIFLPLEGGKIASFKDNLLGKEYLVQNSSPTFLHLGKDGSFVDTECAGFDDMFPTIDPETIKEGERKGLTYSDHGDVCRNPFSYEIDENSVKLKQVDYRLGYAFTKVITEGKYGEIVVNYEIENLKNDELNGLYAGHCLVDASFGAKVVTQFDDGEEVDIVSDITGKFAKKGDRVKLFAELLQIGKTKVEDFCHKMYFPQKVDGGFLKVVYDDGRQFKMSFNGLSYVGVWVNDGIFNNLRCFGLEPCTRGYDRVYEAERHGQKGGIPSLGKINFTIKLEII